MNALQNSFLGRSLRKTARSTSQSRVADHVRQTFILLAIGVLGFNTALKADLILEHISDSELQWSFQGNKLLTYTFGTNQFKPYVRELFTLGGKNVLRDAPADHLHHHGLMYAIRVNDVNFWEENDNPGYQKPIGLLAHDTRHNERGLPEASFTQLIYWVRNEDKDAADSEVTALLVERRTLTLTVNKAAGEVALRWSAAFTPGRQRIKLSGTRYNGLGIRFPVSFDNAAEFQNATGQLVAKRTEQMFKSQWASISGAINSSTAMIAMFSSRDNAGLTTFFAMTEPFAYLSTTQGLDKQPVEYNAHQTFSHDYLVTAYDEPRSRQFFDHRCEQWDTQAR